MRPLYLALDHIGPFSGSSQIDLEKFGDNALFLVCGKTGSGKSFIFDSICYALFGSTPSGREDCLASDFRKEGDRPMILFRFSLGDRLYEVERTLPYLDRKVRGSGTTQKAETACLRMLSPEQQVLAVKKNEVKDGCEELLGLDMKQFSRVMMIPQGDFRELLKADTKAREPLLQALFRSNLYSNITFEIERSYKEAYGRYQDLKKETGIVADQLLSRIPPDHLLPDLSDMEMVHSYRGAIEREIPELERSVLEASAEHEHHRLRATWMKNAIELDEGLRLSEAELERLELDSRQRIDPIRKNIARHDLAMELKPLLDRIDALGTGIARARKRISVHEEAIVKGQGMLDIARERAKSIPDLRSRLSLIISKEGRIEDLLDHLSELAGHEKDMIDLDRELIRSREELKSIGSRIEMTGEMMKDINSRMDSIRKPITDISAASERRRICRDIIEVQKKRDSLAPESERITCAVEDLSEKVKVLSGSFNALEASREGSLASELSARLVHNRPCPVCGSREHPDPARPGSDHVSKEALEEAWKRVETARRELEDLKLKGSTVITNLEGLSERIAQMAGEYPEFEGMDISSLKEIDLRLSTDMESEMKRAKDLLALQDEANRVNMDMHTQLKEQGDITAGTKAMEERAAQTRSLIMGLKQRIARAREEVKDLVDVENDASLASRLEEIRSERTSIPSTIEAIEIALKRAEEEEASIRSAILAERDNLSRSGEELSSLEEGLSSHLKEERYSPFGCAEDVRSGIFAPDVIIGMRSEVANHDKGIAMTRGKLEQKRSDLSTLLSGKDPPSREDLAIESGIELEKARRSEDLKESLSGKRRDIKEIDGSLLRIEKVSSDMREMEPNLRILQDLSEQVKGNVPPKISLERFFLAQRFEEVLIAANSRLSKLSEGRFHLRRGDESASDRNVRTGLEIIVNDSYTGTDRPANTLSGGQMFLSSLALALGLADVVQARSGGIRMDALFIDEGFGSLDEETLQLALKVLSELRNDRMVGVISHVPEMKRQIPNRIEVIPSREGSTIRMVS